MRVLLFLDVLRTKRTRHRAPKAQRDPVRISAFLTDARSRGIVKGEIYSPKAKFRESDAILPFPLARRPKVCYNKTGKAVEL